MKMLKSSILCCFVLINLRAVTNAQVAQPGLRQRTQVGVQREAQGANQGVQQGAPQLTVQGLSTGEEPGSTIDAQSSPQGNVQMLQEPNALASQSGDDFLMTQIGYRLLGSLFERPEPPEPTAPSEATYAESSMFGFPHFSAPGAERSETPLLDMLFRSIIIRQLQQYNPAPMSTFQGMTFNKSILVSI